MVILFLAKNLSNFVSLLWKLHIRECHTAEASRCHFFWKLNLRWAFFLLNDDWDRIHHTIIQRLSLAHFRQCAMLRNSGSMEISNGYTSQASHQMFMDVLPSKLYVSVKNSELLKWCWIFSGIEFPFWALNTKGPCYVVNKISFLLFHKFHCLWPCLMLE